MAVLGLERLAGGEDKSLRQGPPRGEPAEGRSIRPTLRRKEGVGPQGVLGHGKGSVGEGHDPLLPRRDRLGAGMAEETGEPMETGLVGGAEGDEARSGEREKQGDDGHDDEHLHQGIGSVPRPPGGAATRFLCGRPHRRAECPFSASRARIVVRKIDVWGKETRLDARMVADRTSKRRSAEVNALGYRALPPKNALAPVAASIGRGTNVQTTPDSLLPIRRCRRAT